MPRTTQEQRGELRRLHEALSAELQMERGQVVDAKSFATSCMEHVPSLLADAEALAAAERRVAELEDMLVNAVSRFDFGMIPWEDHHMLLDLQSWLGCDAREAAKLIRGCIAKGTNVFQTGALEAALENPNA